MVLFFLFTIIGIVRSILHPNLTKDILQDFYQTSFLGAIPITIADIAVGFVLFYGELTGTVWMAYALFWVAVVMSIIVGCIIAWITTAMQEAPELSSVNGVWFLSFIPFLVTSTAGATMVKNLPAEVRGATLVVSFLLWSVGIAMSLIIETIYFWRLVRHKLPPRDAIVSCFIAVGPPAMAAYSIQNLAVALQNYVEKSSYNLSRPHSPDLPYTTLTTSAGTAFHLAVGTAVHWVGVMVGLFFIALATFWLIHSVLSIFYCIPKQFNVGHWSLVFPNAVYANAFSMIAKDLSNKGLRGWAAAISTITVLLWLYCALGTFYKSVWKGQLLFAPGLEGLAEQQAIEEDKEKRRSGIAPRQ